VAIQLHSWPGSSGTRVSWALEELGISYEYIELDGKKLEHRAPQYLAVNPHGKVPALVDGSVTLFESGAILLYLGDKYGVERNLWPDIGGGQTHADAMCWTVWAMADFGNYMMQFAYHGLDSPVSYKLEDRSRACAEYNRSQFVRGLDALQTRLQDREYLLSDFSLADIAVASLLQVGGMCGINVDSHSRVADWLRRCSDRPACRRAR
jgi:glutathione S-transferase